MILLCVVVVVVVVVVVAAHQRCPYCMNVLTRSLQVCFSFYLCHNFTAVFELELSRR